MAFPPSQGAGGGAFTGGAVTSPITFANGTAGAPSMAFTSETGLGFYRFGAGAIGATGYITWPTGLSLNGGSQSTAHVRGPTDAAFCIAAQGSNNLVLYAGNDGSLVAGGQNVTATSGTKKVLEFANGSYGDGGTNSTTVLQALSLTPTINYTGATRTGSYSVFHCNVTETSAPTGTNFLIRTQVGSADRFGVWSSGFIDAYATAINVVGCPVTAELGDLTAYGIDKGPGIQFFGRIDAGSPANVFGAVGAYKENATEANTAGYVALWSRPAGGLNCVAGLKVTSTQQIQIPSGSGYGFSSSATNAAAADTAFSRTAAGKVALGNGTAGNKSGTLQLTTLEGIDDLVVKSTGGGSLFLDANTAPLIMRIAGANTARLESTFFGPQSDALIALGGASNKWKALYLDYTNDTTAGDAATINKACGRFRKDTSGSTFTVTNSLVTAASKVFCTLLTTAMVPGPDLCMIHRVTPGAGSFVVEFNGVPDANVDVDFLVVNAD